MYNRASRFNTVYSATPARVGPATYSLSDIFDKGALSSRAPFNTTQIRDTSFVNKNLAQNPSPNTYKIRFRKIRIVGGTNLKNRAARFKYKVLDVTKGPYFDKEPKKLTGKLYNGVPLRKDVTIPSIPEKDTRGYILTNDGPVKVPRFTRKQPIGPTTYFNPEGHESYTTKAYRGNFWSLRTANRFHSAEDEGPGPDTYLIDSKTQSSSEMYQNYLRSLKQAEAPLLRTNDILQRKLCREGFPGPGAYDPNDPNTTKCDWGKFGTFSKALRKDLFEKNRGPGPADYDDPRLAISKAKPTNPDRYEEIGQAKIATNWNVPEPGEYNPKNDTISDTVLKKARSKYSGWNAPFDSSAARNTVMTNPDAACIPGPDWYYPQFQKRGIPNKSSMFASKSAWEPMSQNQVSPGPAAYTVMESFKTVTQPKSHLQSQTAGFYSSACRLGPLKESDSPDPTTYDVPNSSLRTNACKIGQFLNQGNKEVTPGPPDYEVHQKYAKSSIFNTHNITLQQPKKTVLKKLKTNMPKKLKCFTYQHFTIG